MPRTALIRLLLVGVLLVTLSIFLEPGSLATMLYSYEVSSRSLQLRLTMTIDPGSSVVWLSSQRMRAAWGPRALYATYLLVARSSAAACCTGANRGSKTIEVYPCMLAEASAQSMVTDWCSMSCKLRRADERDGTPGLVVDSCRSRRGDDGKNKK